MKERIEKFLDGKIEDLNALAEKYPEQESLLIDWQALEKFDSEIAENLLTNAYGHDQQGNATGIIHLFEEALRDRNLPVLEFGPSEMPEFHVRFFNLPKEEGYTFRIRDLDSSSINKFISTIAVVNHWISDKFIVDPPNIARFKCSCCKRSFNLKQEREDRLKGQITSPLRCPECGKTDFRYIPEESDLIDRQIVEIQEPKEIIESGDWPRKIRVWIEGKELTKILTNKDVGKKIVVTGILIFHPPIKEKFIEANNILVVDAEPEDIPIKKKEKEKIIKWSTIPKL